MINIILFLFTFSLSHYNSTLHAKDPFAELFADFGADGSDPFAQLFGEDFNFAEFDDDFSSPPPPSPFRTEQSSDKSKKTEIHAVTVKNNDEAFKTAIPTGVKKIPKIYKEGLEKHLSACIKKLREIDATCNGFTLSISHQETLKKEAIPYLQKAVQLLEKIRTQPVYHLVLYDKEFTTLRSRITSGTKEADKSIKSLYDLESIASDNDPLAPPTTRITRKQNDVVTKITSLVKHTIKPIIDDAEKLLNHTNSKQRIETKKKKYTDRSQKASQMSRKGYGGSSGYHGSYDDYGFGNYDSRGFGNSWDYDFGGGGWDSFFNGGNFGYGGSGDYGSYYSPSSNRSNASTSSTSPSQNNASPTTVWSNDSSGNSYPQASNESNKKATPYHPSSHHGIDEDAPPAQRLEQLCKKMIIHLSRTQLEYEKASDKLAYLHTLLGASSFVGDTQRLVTIAQLIEDPECIEALESTTLKKSYQKFINTTIKAIPVLIGVLKYAAPSSDDEIIESLLIKNEKMSEHEIKRSIEAAKRHRLKNYQNLMSWLAFVRGYKQEALKNALVEELRIHAARTIEKLTDLLHKHKENTPLSLTETTTALSLSKQLFEEPVVIGYSSIPNETDEQKEAHKDALQTLITEKKSLERTIQPVLSLSAEILDTAKSILTDAQNMAQEALNSKNSLDDISSADRAMSHEIAKKLNTTYRHNTQYQILKSMLLPYTEATLENLEKHSLLHADLQALWKPQSLPDAQAEESGLPIEESLEDVMSEQKNTTPLDAKITDEFSHDVETIKEEDETPPSSSSIFESPESLARQFGTQIASLHI